jgi:hypothetical protein
MNRFRTQNILTGLVLSLGLALTGCLTDDPAEETGGPTISISPSDQLVSVGSTATFSVTATGNGTLTYQWMKDGTDIAGATSATYAFTAGNSDDGAEYKVKVTDSKGTTTSSGAFLRIQVTTKTVTLGAQSSVTASSLDLDTWTSYTASNAPAQSSTIDLVFAYSTAQDSSAIYSPKAAKDGVGGSSGFDFMQSWTTTNNTEFKAVSMDLTNFTNVNTAAEIKSLFDGATAPTPAGRVFVKSGTVIVAKSNGGLYVLIRITNVIQTAAGQATLTGKAKW